MTVVLRPVETCTTAEFLQVANHLRDADRRELRVVGGQEPVPALTNSVRTSHESLLAFDDGGAFAIIGYRTAALSSLAIPWMVATDRLRQHKKAALVYGRRFVQHLVKNYELIENYVHADNELHIEYIRRVGLEVDEKFEMQPGVWVHRFGVMGEGYV